MSNCSVCFAGPIPSHSHLRQSYKLPTSTNSVKRQNTLQTSTIQSLRAQLQNDSPSSVSPSRTSMDVSQSSTPLSDSTNNEPLLHVVFVHPQIHWNTGNIGRTCLGLGARLHLISPLGFSLDARQIRRAGLDYWDHVDVHVYDDWSHFANGEMQRVGGERYFFTKFGTQCITQVEWPTDKKVVLIFGSEVDGFDGIRDWLDNEGRDEKLVAFPMVDDRFRSFNLSTTASMALWDAYKALKVRQTIS